MLISAREHRSSPGAAGHPPRGLSPVRINSESHWPSLRRISCRIEGPNSFCSVDSSSVTCICNRSYSGSASAAETLRADGCQLGDRETVRPPGNPARFAVGSGPILYNSGRWHLIVPRHLRHGLDSSRPPRFDSVSSDAAQRTSAPNYDEFQSDVEIWEMLQARPGERAADQDSRTVMWRRRKRSTPRMIPRPSITRKSLEVAAVERPDAGGSGDSVGVPDRLSEASACSADGAGGYGKTAENPYSATPNGCIIRNEGIRPRRPKASRLIRRIKAYIGTVNLAVRDDSGPAAGGSRSACRCRGVCTYEATDEAGNIHRVWIVRDAAQNREVHAMMAAEPAAYVATEITAAPQLRRSGTKSS